jgi:hypothetical protein
MAAIIDQNFHLPGNLEDRQLSRPDPLRSVNARGLADRYDKTTIRLLDPCLPDELDLGEY